MQLEDTNSVRDQNRITVHLFCTRPFSSSSEVSQKWSIQESKFRELNLLRSIAKGRPRQDGDIGCGKGAGGLDCLAKRRKVKAPTLTC